jgi:DNA mismatch repair ATPase MutS
VTTHDLALATMVDRISPPGENVHFADQVEGGTLSFDYQLRSGVATQGNALILMRALGLPVEAPAEDR